MKSVLLFTTIFCTSFLSAQVYTVNVEDDIDFGACTALHCSLREAINAAEADGVPSTIVFNIPGNGTHTINPIGPFPSVTQSDLKILGETQPGGPGSLFIDFNYRLFGGISFWNIFGNRFYISGIEFDDFLFNNANDHIFNFGDTLTNSTDSRINNCSFITDNSFNPTDTTQILIDVFSANNLRISNCNFGTDHSKSFISKLGGWISIDNHQATGLVIIDSNVFVNRRLAIEGYAGNLSIFRNIFGALDTLKNANFLNPELAIFGDHLAQGRISDNYFLGYTKGAIDIRSMNLSLSIDNNRFFENTCPGVIRLDDNITGGIFITNNFATLFDNNAQNAPHTFIHALRYSPLDVERNEVSNYGSFLIGDTPYQGAHAKYLDNKIQCMWKNAVFMNGYPRPVITSVNKNHITGTGHPNANIVVYSNNRLNCAGAICEAGVELGRTFADFITGNWILNTTFPSHSSISAYQYSSDPNLKTNIYSDFSECYQCLGPVKLNFNNDICTGDTISIFGKTYSDLNPDDSIFIQGDGISICDSIIVVHLTVHKHYFTEVNVTVCYPDIESSDTIFFLNQFCDSVVAINKKLVGLNNFTQTICDTSSVVIDGMRFDKHNSNGIIIFPSAAVSGCDSVIKVNLFYPSIDTSVSNTSGELKANEIGATYQWIDCDNGFAVLHNDTSQHFIPTKNGNYAVIILKNGCIDTSSCYRIITVNVNENNSRNKIDIFPNPANGILYLTANDITPGSIIRIKDAQGKFILEKRLSNSSKFIIDLKNLSSGIYLLEYHDGKNIQRIKFIKI